MMMMMMIIIIIMTTTTTHIASFASGVSVPLLV
jgi:hypothetical protein